MDNSRSQIGRECLKNHPVYIKQDFFLRTSKIHKIYRISSDVKTKNEMNRKKCVRRILTKTLARKKKLINQVRQYNYKLRVKTRILISIQSDIRFL